MKTVIVILLSYLSLAYGQGCPAPDSCHNQTMKHQHCLMYHVKNQTEHNLQELKELEQAIIQCYDEPGVKGVCTLPPHPTPPTPSPEDMACLNGTKQAFVTCLKDALGIPASCHPSQPPPANHSQNQPPHHVNTHFSHGSQAEANKTLLNLCGQNQTAADQLKSCVSKAVKPYLHAIVQIMDPASVLCHAKNVCSKAAPLTAECQAKAESGKETFCKCMPTAFSYFKNSTQCASARAAMASHEAEAKAHEQAKEASNGDHGDIHNHPDAPMSFCQPNYDPCKEAQEKIKKLEAEHNSGR